MHPKARMVALDNGKRVEFWKKDYLVVVFGGNGAYVGNSGDGTGDSDDSGGGTGRFNNDTYGSSSDVSEFFSA